MSLPANQPTSYAPEILEGRFRQAGFEGYRRLFHLLFVLVGFAFGFWRDARLELPLRLTRQRQRAIWLREEMVKLGPTFVKIGQVLSTRPDLVPLPYVDEMALLQDQVPPFDSDVAHQIIREELGRPLEQIFAVINPFPIAAASIGQVYKAKLVDGTEVVVKVQRPGLIPVVMLDLAIMRKVTAWIDRHPKLSRGMPYTAILDEFGITMFEQADYAKEGHHAERFRDNFRAFPGIGTPRIHWEYTTSRVMTMDFVHGMKVTDLVALTAAGISFEEVVKLGVRASIKQILEDGFFHADVHPGNLFVDYDGQLIYIDFGMVGELSLFTQEKIVDVFLHSVHRQYAALVDDFIALGFLSPLVDRTALLPIAEAIFTAQYGETDNRMSVKEIFTAISQVLYQYPFRIPEKIAFLLRTLMTLEGIIHKLWPDFRFLEVAGPYAAKILLTDAKASIREKLVDELFEDGQFRPDRLARLFGTATREPTFRFGEVAPAVLRYLSSPEGGRVRDGLLSGLGEAPGGAGAEVSWHVYVDKAADDPDWTLDDVLLPVLHFLQTEDGVTFLVKLMDRREIMVGASGAGWGSLGVAIRGRTASPALVTALVAALGFLLQHTEVSFQPVVERMVAFLDSEAGEDWFVGLGEHLKAHGGALGGTLVGLLAQAASHPHLDIAPLVRGFVGLATRPRARAWQDLLVSWAKAGSSNEGVVAALQPLLADGRLRLSDLALPAVGLLFSKDGAQLRDELVTSLRQRVEEANLPGIAQNLWRAAGQAWTQWRSEAPAPTSPPGPEADSAGEAPTTEALQIEAAPAPGPAPRDPAPREDEPTGAIGLPGRPNDEAQAPQRAGD